MVNFSVIHFMLSYVMIGQGNPRANRWDKPAARKANSRDKPTARISNSCD
jgi:hypothetical protein